MDTTNIVLLAILPYISDFAGKLEIPVPHPLSVNDVVEFSGGDKDVDGCVMVKGGYQFNFEHGHVIDYSSPHSYFTLQEPKEIPKFFGKPAIGGEEAVALARRALRNLGYADEDVFADLSPKVIGPTKLKGETIPFFKIQWHSPNIRSEFVELEIDGVSGKIEGLSLCNPNCNRPDPFVPNWKPKVKRESLPAQIDATAVSNEVLLQIPEVVRKLDPLLPKGGFEKHEISNIKQAEPDFTTLKYKNGWSLTFMGTAFFGFEAPDAFFKQGKINAKDYVGRTRLSKREMIKLAEKTVEKLGFSARSLGMNRSPKIHGPYVQSPSIPRFYLTWYDQKGRVGVEVDGEKGIVKSLKLQQLSARGGDR